MESHNRPHRRSFLHQNEERRSPTSGRSGDGGEKKSSPSGRLYPDLFNAEDGDYSDGEDSSSGAHSQPISRPWPSAPSEYLLEEQYEEDEEEEEDAEGREKDDQAEPSARKRRGDARKSTKTMPTAPRRSLPSQRMSRSRSGQREKEPGEEDEGEEQQSHADDTFWTLFQRNMRQWTEAEIELKYFMGAALFAVLLIIFLMFIIPLLIAMNNGLDPKERFTNFQKDLHGIVTQIVLAAHQNEEGQQANFTQQQQNRIIGDIERMLVYIADAMLRRRMKAAGREEKLATRATQSGPLTLLITSKSEEQADGLAKQFLALLRAHWPEYRFIDHPLDSTFSRKRLEKQVLGPLLSTASGEQLRQSKKEESQSPVLLLLTGIHKLRANSPLFLHSLADPESSPLVSAPFNVLIVGTLKLEEGPRPEEENETKNGIKRQESFGRACEERITRTILLAWKSEVLSEDQIYPIVSRISAHTICFH